MTHHIAPGTILSGIVAVITIAAPLSIKAQGYPNRPIRMVAPFAPGGGTDISARILAEGMSQELGQPVIVDNRPGAGSILGTDIVAKSTPDGYTLLLGNISMAFNSALYKKLPFDTLTDFIPISLAVEQANILVAHPSLPAKSFKDLVAFARGNPGTLNYGSAGLGSGTHLAMELLMLSLNVKMTHVPFKGTGPALIALLSNEINLFLSTFASALPHVKSGRLQTFGVTTAKRVDALPEAPTIAEAGVPGFDYSTWYGLLGPGKMPAVIVNQLNRVAVNQLNSPDMRKRLIGQGMQPIPSTAAEYSARLKSDVAKWTKVVRQANIPQQ